jgi:hypothetical protein
MGTSGEIYNILGKEFPVTREPKPKFGLSYLLNGRVIVTSEDLGDSFHHDLVSLIPNVPNITLEHPEFCVRVLDIDEYGTDPANGLPAWCERGSFKGIALAGYPIANVSYTSKSTPLPNQREIDALIPQLMKDYEKILGIKVSREEIGVHLLWDF